MNSVKARSALSAQKVQIPVIVSRPVRAAPAKRAGRGMRVFGHTEEATPTPIAHQTAIAKQLRVVTSYPPLSRASATTPSPTPTVSP